MTTPVGATAAATDASRTNSSTGSTSTPLRNDQLDKDAFLKLLVAQLRYQDPLSPAKPEEFMSQTAQFTSVEKLEELTKVTTASSRAIGLSAAGNLVGRTISWYGDDGTLQSGRVSAAMSSADGSSLLVGTEQVPLDGVVRIS